MRQRKANKSSSSHCLQGHIYISFKYHFSFHMYAIAKHPLTCGCINTTFLHVSSLHPCLLQENILLCFYSMKTSLHLCLSTKQHLLPQETEVSPSGDNFKLRKKNFSRPFKLVRVLNTEGNLADVSSLICCQFYIFDITKIPLQLLHKRGVTEGYQ